ncbi:MAG TPA: TadE family protein [Archangium sp.]|uniref:TadE/TadG family type IV pilus assembly protein n=1 Tax=Archangium sp. TaxID=1872627 RepID=UPI002E33B31D|nr:TadE family protein [Archangium sp.]HEX5748585.1 TadE family protein [Archangium sp.]
MAFVTRRHPRGESGQVAVETALIIPLFMFLILGILQLGMIAQTRVMAKYAVYRAARVGAMNHASVDAMEAAAIFHLLPVLVSSSETILPTSSTSDILTKYNRMMAENRASGMGGAKMVEIVICGPTLGELRGTGSTPLPAATQRALHGLGSNNEVDFDDPQVQLPTGFDAQTGEGMRRYNRMRLRVQLQLLYRMPIPFANWIMTRTYLGLSLPSVLMMTDKDAPPTVTKSGAQFTAVRNLANRRIYTLPINVSYAMRMQSNLFLNRFKLPEENKCIHYTP